jgi:hypothetical protein
MTRLALLSSVVALAAAALVGAPARSDPAAAAGKPCGRIHVLSGDALATYRVRVIKGRMTCVRARALLLAFSRTDRNPRGWVCFRGHASQSQAWAATCASADGRRAVRSWLVKS